MPPDPTILTDPASLALLVQPSQTKRYRIVRARYRAAKPQMIVNHEGKPFSGYIYSPDLFEARLSHALRGPFRIGLDYADLIQTPFTRAPMVGFAAYEEPGIFWANPEAVRRIRVPSFEPEPLSPELLMAFRTEYNGVFQSYKEPRITPAWEREQETELAEALRRLEQIPIPRNLPPEEAGVPARIEEMKADLRARLAEAEKSRPDRFARLADDDGFDPYELTLSA
jgi:hypothetical protein